MPKTADLDEELVAGLKQARKKPLNYCLIAKGVEVVKLIVQKKKIPAGEAQKAKAEFKGNKTVMGVIAGDGVELSFEVVGEDPGIPPKKIREYISEQTGMTLKPEWKVVTELSEVEETEAEGEQASAPSPPQAPPPPPTQQPPPPPQQPTNEKLPDAPPPQPQPDLLKELLAKMNKLTPLIQAAAQANPQRKGDLLKPVAAFQAQVKANDAQGAQESLKELAALLKELTSGGSVPPPVTPPVPPGNKTNEIPPAPPPPVVNREEKEQGETEGEQSEADSKADRFKQDWAAARKKLRLAIDKVEEQLLGLADALIKSNDPNMVWVAEEGLTHLISGLRGSATTIDKSASKTPAKVAAFAKPAIAELEKQLSSQQIKVCDQNKFGVKVTVKSTIEQAIAELVQTLDSAV